MIPVESILYKLDLKLNKVGTHEHQQIPLEDKLVYANEAQLALLVDAFDTEDTRKLGLDGFLKRYQDMEPLVVPWKEIPLEATGDPLHRWTGPMPENSAVFISAYVTATKGACAQRPLYGEPVKHGDLTLKLRHSHYKPSFEYEATLLTLSEGKLEAYTDGTFVLHTAAVSYLRYPKPIDYEGYTRLDGTDSVTQDSELPGYLEDRLINLAAQLITASLTHRTQAPQ